MDVDTLVRAGVKDRMTGEIVYKTRKASYYIAHTRAEKWCKRNLGDRGTIVVLYYYYQAGEKWLR